MNLLLVRHAIAEDREEFSRTHKNDWLRPLTKQGREKMRRLSQEYGRMFEQTDVLCHSPLTRAVQTAEILAKELKPKYQIETEALAPDADPIEFVKWVQDYAQAQTVVAVGHEPHLSFLAGTFVHAHRSSGFEFKKGGGALIALDRGPIAGHGQLVWLVTPKLLLR